jgi:hypothetical protein
MAIKVGFFKQRNCIQIELNFKLLLQAFPDTEKGSCELFLLLFMG